MNILHSFLGLLSLALIAWLLSEDKKNVCLKTIAAGLTTQLILAFILLKLPGSKNIFLLLNHIATGLQTATEAGTSMVFGYLGGGGLPFDEKFPGASYILAFRGLPLILVVSALSSLLFHWRIMPRVVKGFSWILQKTMRVGGALGVGTAANIFVGMVEAPLFIRPYLASLTRNELFSIMTCGMATVAGTVMVLYASILNGAIPDALGHILIASIISAPAAITVARIIIPESEETTAGEIMPPRSTSGAMDAVCHGTVDGVQLLINITAMLVVLVALVHLANLILGILPDIGNQSLTLQRLLGYIMAPIVWLMGVPWSEARTAGSLMGTKTILNEFLAYLEMARLPEGALSPRSTLIMTYAMCGFANFGSLGIMIGGLGSMAPERRNEVVALGMKSIVAGTLATCMTGAVVGIFL